MKLVWHPRVMDGFGKDSAGKSAVTTLGSQLRPLGAGAGQGPCLYAERSHLQLKIQEQLGVSLLESLTFPAMIRPPEAPAAKKTGGPGLGLAL